MLLAPDHVNALHEHLLRHHAENGQDGFHFMAPTTEIELLTAYDPHTWGVPPGSGRWQRVFAWQDERGAIRAHVVLSGLARTPHRCDLAAGVEAPFRRHGLGRGLMREALHWVSRWPAVEWVDGWAFANNAPVLALDAQVGFVEVGRVRDVVRIDGQKLDQVFMVIDLGGGA